MRTTPRFSYLLSCWIEKRFLMNATQVDIIAQIEGSVLFSRDTLLGDHTHSHDMNYYILLDAILYDTI